MAKPQPFRDFIVKYKKGDRVYSKGDQGTEMYIVQSGAVEIFRESDAGRVRLAIMEKGDFFGEMALIESSPHDSWAEAQEDCDLLEISSTLFDRMIKGNIEIAVRMLRKLSMRLRDATRLVEELRAGGIRAEAMVGEGPATHTTVLAAEPTMITQTGVPPVVNAPGDPVEAGKAERPKDCHAYFVSEDGKQIFYLVMGRATIGRFDPVTCLKPEVDLSSLDLNRSVSRHHARVDLEGGVYTVTEEVGALNGTFVNSKKLVTGKSARINDGDSLNLGMVKLTFRKV